MTSRLLLGVIVSSSLALATVACGVDSLNPVTPQGRSIADYFGLVMLPSVLVLAFVSITLAYVILRFRGREGDPEPEQVEGHQRLEIVWTAVPILLLAGLLTLMIPVMTTVTAGSSGALRVRAIGHQWWWEFDYPDLGVVTANELRVPAGVPLRIEVETVDVLHSFWVPRIGWKKDAINGKTNVIDAVVDETGTFDGACTEYCGTQHAWMRQRVIAVPAGEFDTWVQQQRAPAQATPAGARGREVFLSSTCVNCHAIRGTSAAARIGPDLTHLASRSLVAGGVVANTTDDLRRWIRNPHDFKPGVLMPGYASLPEADLIALAEWLGTLT